jgi:primosomal replication protein N
MPATEEGDKEVEAKAEEQAEVRLEAQVVGEQTEFLVEVTEGEKRLD